MFKLIDEPVTIDRDNKKYLAFPDIIQSKEDPNKIFLIYRTGDAHHPKYSTLNLWVSQDKGYNWQLVEKFKMSFKEHGRVWNCPRFSYFPNGSFNIISDSKNSTNERKAHFITYKIESHDDGMYFSLPKNIGIDGMLPDHIVKFKGEHYIANHLNDLENHTLVQFVNISRDKCKTWYERAIMGRVPNPGPLSFSQPRFYCEASILNFHDDYLWACVRDNTIGPQPLHTFISKDGRHWDHNGTLPINGHRPTVLFREKEDRVFIAYRDTKALSIAVLTAKISKKGTLSQIEEFNIDTEGNKKNLFHMGYTGLVEYEPNKFLLTYYIKQKAIFPYIKLARLEWSS